MANIITYLHPDFGSKSSGGFAVLAVSHRAAQIILKRIQLLRELHKNDSCLQTMQYSGKELVYAGLLDNAVIPAACRTWMARGNTEEYCVTEGGLEIPDDNAWRVVARRMTVFSDGLMVDVEVEGRDDVYRTPLLPEKLFQRLVGGRLA